MTDRRFDVVSAFSGAGTVLPQRATTGSAGYDLCTLEPIDLPPSGRILVSTGIKVYLPPGEFLLIAIRSSLGRRGIMLANGIGIIDGDYVDNDQNEGHIQMPIWNSGEERFSAPAGSRVAQAIFMPFLVAGGEGRPRRARVGGFGSTGS